MSRTLIDQQRAEDRRAKVMKMNYTKVKPTVVKHVLPNEVMSIYERKVSRIGQRIRVDWILISIFEFRCIKINYTSIMTCLWRKDRKALPCLCMGSIQDQTLR